MKMKKYLLIFCIVLAQFVVFAQPKPDSAAVATLLEESKSYFTSDATKALNLATQAVAGAQQLGLKKEEGYAYKNIGITYYFQGKYIEALENYNRSLEIFKGLKDYVGIANLQNNIGAVYYDRADYARALEYYLQSLKNAESSGDKLRILSALNNIGGVYSIKPATKKKALEYYLRALELCKELGSASEMGAVCTNIGEIYFAENDDAKAFYYFNQSLQAYGETEGSLNAYNALGRLYAREGKYQQAGTFHNKALQLAMKLENDLSILQSLMGLANVHAKQGDYAKAIEYFKQAEIPASRAEENDDTKDLYREMSLAYMKLGDYKNAYHYQALFSDLKDTIYNLETDKKLGSLQFDFDLHKKEGEIKLLTKDKELTELSLARQKLTRNAFAIGMLLVFLITLLIYRNYKSKVKTNKILDHQNKQIESLLLNILPSEVAQELQESGEATPRNYESVSVLFTDFKGFTTLTEKMDPGVLVKELSDCFVAFDNIVGKYNLEKIKTIGDSYMCAGGLPTPDKNHAINIVKASLEIQSFMYEHNRKKEELGLPPWHLRIGIHAGPVIAGVVGKRKYAYDIWGSTVNIASRMESNGEAGRVNISSSVYALVKNEFSCSHRGKVYAKNVGEIDMYFVEESPGIIPGGNTLKNTFVNGVGHGQVNLK